MLRNWALALRPSLSLDFLAGLNDSRITYSGGANGTRVNSSGNIVAATTPRFDYDPVTLAAKGLLIEEQRTNLCLDSGNWNTNLFLASAAPVTPAPGGLCNQRITFTASAAAVTGKFNTAGNTTLQYANTVRIKAGSFTSGFVSFRNNAQTIGIQYAFDLTAVTLTDASYGSPTSKITPSIKLVGGGEYEITIGGVLNSGGGPETTAFFVYPPSAAGGTLDVGAGQIEVGAFATSYIPTTSASVTRTADSAVMTGTNFSSWYNQSEGTFVFQYANAPTDTARPVVTVRRSGDANYRLQMDTLFSYAIDAGAITSATGTGAVKAGAKIGSSFKTDNFATSTNGGALSTNTSGANPNAIDQMTIGYFDFGSASRLNGHIRSIAYYPVRMSNEQLQALTA